MPKNVSHSNLTRMAVVTASIVGTLASLMLSKRNKGQMEKIKEKIMGREDNFNKTILLGSIIGGVIGVAAALLLTPKSGDELVQDLSDTLQKGKEKLKKAAETGKEKVEEMISSEKMHSSDTETTEKTPSSSKSRSSSNIQPTSGKTEKNG